MFFFFFVVVFFVLIACNTFPNSLETALTYVRNSIKSIEVLIRLAWNGPKRSKRLVKALREACKLSCKKSAQAAALAGLKSTQKIRVCASKSRTHLSRSSSIEPQMSSTASTFTATRWFWTSPQTLMMFRFEASSTEQNAFKTK